MLQRVQQVASQLQHIPAAISTSAVGNLTTMAAPEITLYTAQTPNGVKVSIVLEELGVPYTVKKLNFSTNEQKEPWFLKVNPNGRIPALTDHKSPANGGSELHLFESGSIMLYLVDQYDKEHKLSYPKNTKEYYDMTNWLFFQNAGLGPMQGQANHFNRYCPEKIQYGIDRYVNETRRLYGVMQTRLAEQESNGGFLVGSHISIADIACYGWVKAAPWAGIDMDEFPGLQAWLKRCESREALKKGADVPEPSHILEVMKDKAKMEEYEAKSRAWVQEGMKADRK